MKIANKTVKNKKQKTQPKKKEKTKGMANIYGSV